MLSLFGVQWIAVVPLWVIRLVPLGPGLPRRLGSEFSKYRHLGKLTLCQSPISAYGPVTRRVSPACIQCQPDVGLMCMQK